MKLRLFSCTYSTDDREKSQTARARVLVPAKCRRNVIAGLEPAIWNCAGSFYHAKILLAKAVALLYNLAHYDFIRGQRKNPPNRNLHLQLYKHKG